jgi:hypothetical protein
MPQHTYIHSIHTVCMYVKSLISLTSTYILTHACVYVKPSKINELRLTHIHPPTGGKPNLCRWQPLGELANPSQPIRFLENMMLIEPDEVELDGVGRSGVGYSGEGSVSSARTPALINSERNLAMTSQILPTDTPERKVRDRTAIAAQIAALYDAVEAHIEEGDE